MQVSSKTSIMDIKTNFLDSNRPSSLYQYIDGSSRHAIYPSLSAICKSKELSLSQPIAENVHDNLVYNSYERCIRRKRGRPKKSSLEHFEILKTKQEPASKLEIPPLKFVDRRQSNPLTPARPTHPSEDHWPTNKTEFVCSDLIKQIAYQHDFMSDSVSKTCGCYECLHGNDLYYQYSRECRGDSEARFLHGHERLLYNRQHHGLYPARNPLEHDIIAKSYPDYNSLKYSRAHSIVHEDEASPVILECYSLAKGKANSKAPLHHHSIPTDDDHDSSKKLHDISDKDSQLTYNHSMNSKPCNNFDRNCMLCNQMAETARAQARFNEADEDLVSLIARDQQTRVKSFSPVRPTLEDQKAQPTEAKSQRSHEDQKTRSEIENTSKCGEVTDLKDYYEIYHSKYYKKKPKWEGYNEEEIKMSTERNDKNDHDKMSPTNRNKRNEDGIEQSNEEKNSNEHLITYSAERCGEDTKYEKVPEVISSFNTNKAPSPLKDDAPPSAAEIINHTTKETTACSPENLGEFPKAKNWDTAYKEFFQHSCEHDPTSKGHTCGHCGRCFTHLSSLNNHIRTHTGQKPFRCRYCGKRFAQSGVLTAHLRTHTGDRPFECSHCKKRFAQTTTLANHIRTHTGQKPFSCKYCKRTFAQSSTRNKHELSHTKEKPYTCKFCGRSFGQSATVTRHMRIHMRQETYLCVHCGKEFPYLHVLDKHLDSHTR